MTDPIDPRAARTVEPTVQHPGMTQIVRDGRCYQVAAVGKEATAMLRHHAVCVTYGRPLPDYGSRWPKEIEDGR